MKPMTNEEFRQALEDYTGWKGKVFSWRADSDVSTPYIVDCDVSENDFRADNIRYHKATQHEVMLLTYQGNGSKGKQREKAEAKVEAFFDENGIPFEKDVSWLRNEQLFETQYTVNIYHG